MTLCSGPHFFALAHREIKGSGSGSIGSCLVTPRRVMNVLWPSGAWTDSEERKIC